MTSKVITIICSQKDMKSAILVTWHCFRAKILMIFVVFIVVIDMLGLKR